jgi:hypothetical protein
MSVNNFQVATWVDGRSDFSFGPPRADGGFRQVIYVRDRGGSRKALTVAGEVGANELLTLRVLDEEGQEVYRVEARR